jgi:Arc/MetJ family transcription regulator
MRMRTNVVLDEILVERAKTLTGIKTTRAVIAEALRLLVQLREQGEARDLRGRLRWEGNLAALRESRTVEYDAAVEGAAPHAAG